MNNITVLVQSIGEVLNKKELKIPEYQRPYKWERRHIRNLFYDIREANSNNLKEYRIGSIIFHDKDKDNVDIVDGQQRLVSISLFLYLMDKAKLPLGASSILSNKFLEVSCYHAKQNFDEWQSLCNLIPDEKKEIANFIQNNCKVSVITMPKDNLVEAFQLFDSQNNRGRALKPYDLLKAYHLRAIKNPTEETIKNWESFIKAEKLNLEDLFDKHLFRIRRWAVGNTGLYKKKYGSELKFSERFIDDFKGVTLESGSYPYLNLYKELKEKNVTIPNSLNMPIINGEAFFQFIEYAYTLFNDFFYTGKAGEKVYSEHLIGDDDVSEMLNSKKPKYSRNINLYINLISLFIDRFGECKLDGEICKKVFVWAFYPRVEAKSIYDSTVANYAAGGVFRRKPTYQKMFQLLVASPTPRAFVASIDTDLLDNLSAQDIIGKLQDGGGK